MTAIAILPPDRLVSLNNEVRGILISWLYDEVVKWKLSPTPSTSVVLLKKKKLTVEDVFADVSSSGETIVDTSSFAAKTCLVFTHSVKSCYAYIMLYFPSDLFRYQLGV